jgi:DnaK suppressor protein
MPAKKPAKTQKQSSKPAASKAAAKKKSAVGKAKATPKPVAKPAAKPVAKTAAKPVVKVTPKPVTKPAKGNAAPSKPVAGKAAAKSAAAAPAKPITPAVKPVAAPKTIAPAAKPSGKPESKPVAAPAKPVAKPVAAPKAAEPLTPPTPIRSAVAVKSSVPSVKSKKDAAAAPIDAEDDQSDSLSLLAGPRNVKPYQVKRDEEYMNQAQLEHFRTILQSWKKDLMNEVDRTVLHMKDEAANFPDPNDRATQESEFSLELRTRDRERKLIRKIEEALNRIEDGSYGYCTETGEEIGVKRLEARPVATLCVEAQERRERRERQYGDRDDRYR